MTRTIDHTHKLRNGARSHERFLVVEVFGRYARFTALLPTMAGAVDRCIIPEYPCEVERLAELLSGDRRDHARNYSVVLLTESAKIKDDSDLSFEGEEKGQYGHKKLGGIGDRIAEQHREQSPEYNDGRPVNIINQCQESRGC